MARVYLIRHGETRWNQEDRIQGWSHVGLSDTGREQAHAVGEFLADTGVSLKTLNSSDLPRTVETAEEIGAVTPYEDVVIETDAAWRERDFGVFQGFKGGRFFETFPEYAILETGTPAAENTPEQGESYKAFDARIRDAWSTFLAENTHDEACIVTHSGVIRQIVAAIKDIDYQAAIRDIAVDHCSVTVISHEDDTCRIVEENRSDFF